MKLSKAEWDIFPGSIPGTAPKPKGLKGKRKGLKKMDIMEERIFKTLVWHKGFEVVDNKLITWKNKWSAGKEIGEGIIVWEGFDDRGWKQNNLGGVWYLDKETKFTKKNFEKIVNEMIERGVFND